MEMKYQIFLCDKPKSTDHPHSVGLFDFVNWCEAFYTLLWCVEPHNDNFKKRAVSVAS